MRRDKLVTIKPGTGPGTARQCNGCTRRCPEAAPALQALVIGFRLAAGLYQIDM
jgi:hypothetical protein